MNDDFLITYYKAMSYPYTGQHYLLEYFSWNIQSKYILAKNKKTLLIMLNNAMNYVEKKLRCKDFEIKSLRLIDIQPPSRDTFLKLARRKFKDDVENFERRLCAQAARYYEITNTLIDGFRLCDTYEYEDEDGNTLDEYWEGDEEMKSYYSNNHSLCKFCYDKMIMNEYDHNVFIKNNPSSVVNVFSEKDPTHSTYGSYMGAPQLVADFEYNEVPTLIYFNIIEGSIHDEDVDNAIKLYKESIEAIEKKVKSKIKISQENRELKEAREIEEYFAGLKR